VRGILVRVSIVGILVTAFFALTLPAMASATTVQLTKNEQLLVTLVNQKRANHGLKPVVVNAKLVASARGHAVEMATRKYFYHDSYIDGSYSGEHFDRRIMRYGYTMSGYTYWRAGENLYLGSGPLYSSPVAAVYDWMHSKAHRAVILGANFRNIGVGTGFRSSYRGQSNVTFFTLDMGRRY
jgi:uncharacterized protein YkwD